MSNELTPEELASLIRWNQPDRESLIDEFMGDVRRWATGHRQKCSTATQLKQRDT